MITNENLEPMYSLEEFEEAEKAFQVDADNYKNWTAVPLLNYTPLHQLKDHTLVRFRGMIQDMYDPEIYMERYEVKAENGQSHRVQNGKYRDGLVLKEGEEINYCCDSNVQGERRCFFVVSLPGINQWTTNYEEQFNQNNVPKKHATGENARKRPATSENEESMEVDQDLAITSAETNSRDAKKCKRMQEETQQKPPTGGLSAAYLLNSPIPERPSKACLVKMYKDFDSCSLNTIIDVVGFLSVDPALYSFNNETIDEEFGFGDEVQAMNPPPSLIPRIHAIAVHELPHANPLLDNRLQVSQSKTLEAINMYSVQKDLRTLLMLCLFNDELAADYLLSHLISTVYSRADMESIGKFSLNLCSLPLEQMPDYTQKLYEILESLLPVSHYLPLSLMTLNQANFMPKKDYVTNKLVSGLLQLAPHTHLVLDETQMQQGKLDPNGVANLQGIAQLINHQQLKCDFDYYAIDYNVNVPVLVLSEGKSMLPNDFLLPLKTDNESVQLIQETFKAAHHFLHQTRLEQFRRFLTMAKTCQFEMNPDVSEMIQNDFVAMRRAGEVTAVNELHALLVLSRLLAIARGKATLDKESWELAKSMENQRHLRIKQLPKSSRRIPT